MTPTPVGMRCPECSAQKTRVVRNPTGSEPGFWRSPATYVLIGLNVVAFLIEIAAGNGGFRTSQNSITVDFGVAAPFIAEGELYRLVTNGFLHYGIAHILFNMFALFVIGQLLEPALGTGRFLALYFASLLAGSFGALLIDPNAITAGASGAIFGIFGATMVIARGRGMNQIAGQLGILLGLNLLITFTIPGISVGGHLGGLAGGVICAAAIVAGEKGRLGPKHHVAEYLVMAAVAVAAVLGSIAVA